MNELWKLHKAEMWSVADIQPLEQTRLHSSGDEG